MVSDPGEAESRDGFVLSEKRLREYRQGTFHLQHRVRSLDEALNYVNERGFIFFWPIKDLFFPSLWAAVAGDRPVPDEHDDPGHITWDWKDSMLGKRRWYYARVLRRRNTIISLQAAPFFYALSQNFGAPEEDYLEQYRSGHLTQEAKSVYEALLREGPLDSITLRRVARLASNDNNGRFNKALDDLQIDFKVLPVGVSDAGSWHYSFIYDLTFRHFPEITEQARFIQENQARARLAEMFWRSLGAAAPSDLTRAFGWNRETAEKVVERLIQGDTLVPVVRPEPQKSALYAIPDLA